MEEKRGLADYGGYGSPTPGASAAAKARAAGGGGGGGAGGASAVEDGDENYAVRRSHPVLSMSIHGQFSVLVYIVFCTLDVGSMCEQVLLLTLSRSMR